MNKPFHSKVERSYISALRHPPRPCTCAKLFARKPREIWFLRSGMVIKQFSGPRAFDWYPFQLNRTSPRSNFISSKFDAMQKKWQVKARKLCFLISFGLWQPNVPGFFRISNRRTQLVWVSHQNSFKSDTSFLTPFYPLSIHSTPKPTLQWPVPYFEI